MSSSIPIRFLLDENVRNELAKLLCDGGADFKTAKKGSSDAALARISLSEHRVLVTNDKDFANAPRSSVFGVILLKVPQNDPALLLKVFDVMLVDNPRYADALVILEPAKWNVLPLPAGKS